VFNCLCIASRGKHTTDIIEQRANWTQQYVNKATITTSRSLNYRLRSSPENEMRMKYSDCLLFTWSVCVMRRRRRSRRCLEHHESPNTPITANRTQAAATVDGAYIENLKSAPAKPQSVTLSICVFILQLLLLLLLLSQSKTRRLSHRETWCSLAETRDMPE